MCIRDRPETEGGDEGAAGEGGGCQGERQEPRGRLQVGVAAAGGRARGAGHRVLLPAAAVLQVSCTGENKYSFQRVSRG